MCQSHNELRTEPHELLYQYGKASGSGSSLDGEPDGRSGMSDCSSTDAASLDDPTEQVSRKSSLDDIAGLAVRDGIAKFLSTHGLASCKPERLLGMGATCRVELVRVQLPEGGPCLPAARKTMPRSRDPHLRAKEDAVFARELEGLRAGGCCPFVVRLLGSSTQPDRQELLMELAEGATLEHELTDALGAVRGELSQPLLPPARIAQVAASVLTALHALHAQGYAHLDIKPANLLRTAEGRLMVGDAGCMQRVAPEDGLLHLPASGTPLFAAPETKRKGAFSPKADLYSLGVLLAVCAAWHRQTGRVLAFLRGQAALPGFVPGELADLVARLVAEEPEARPSAAEALQHPFLAGVDLTALAPVRGGPEGCCTVPR
ncbi:hypothetical protein PLESTB_000914300 [Pleodorina starrii]|uniref:Protein kinase domain-containing protein n=1 Tax=Pleodorina starrii TaxID=330485 RepID=A0A9W6BMA1_9CHLO|nr:hypothetical protein PLESTB_000914300 [Pleodorina starrii]GLC73685.1 hypothetical protein PLESTF_001408200 [Pleodorina starrii]